MSRLTIMNECDNVCEYESWEGDMKNWYDDNDDDDEDSEDRENHLMAAWMIMMTIVLIQS